MSALGRTSAVACLAAVVAGGACGKKGPPLAPLRPVPAAVADLAARRMGGDVHIQLRIPDENVDGTAPADVARVEVHAITGPAADLLGRPYDERMFIRRGALVGALDVEPPPPPEDETEEGEPGETPAPPRPPDPRPAQRELAVVIETLTPETFQPPPPERDELPPPVSPPRAVRVTPPLVGAMEERPLTRTYLVFGVSGAGRPGAAARASVSLGPVPPAPAAPDVTYTETAIRVGWQRPAGLRQPVQGPQSAAFRVGPAGDPPLVPLTLALLRFVSGELLASHPLGGTGVAIGFNVYEVRPGQGDPSGALQPTTPLNARLVAATTYQDARVEFGAERCFQVRSIIVTGELAVESEPSPVACVTPVDHFPPAAPRALAAVGSEGAINLIWEPNPDKDLAGYLVLRGDAPGETLQALTAAPITETTYSDTSAKPGVRYVYAVVAVDTAQPPNTSAHSNHVEESAR